MPTFPPVNTANERRVRLRAIMERTCGSVAAACEVIGWHTTTGYRRTNPLGVGGTTRSLQPKDLVAALKALGVDPSEIFSPVLLEGDAQLLRWIQSETPTIPATMARLRSVYGELRSADHILNRLMLQGFVVVKRGFTDDDRLVLTSEGRKYASDGPVPAPKPKTLREMRLSKGLTQDQCAMFAGFTRQAWSIHENKGAAIAPEMLAMLEDAINKASADFSA